MFKNVSYAKKMWQKCKWNIWSSFLFLTLNKLLTKPVWVIKSLFYLFWHWFITLSYKLQKAFKYVFAKLHVKMERKFYQRFLPKVIKKESPPWMFSKSRNFLQMVFGWQQREKQQHYKKLKQIADVLAL